MLPADRLDQITHHIFMLVPVAAAAACFLRPLPPARLAWPDALGGGLLGLALWISPETMPLVAGFAAVRAVLKLESAAPTPSLTPVAVGLLAVVALGWWASRRDWAGAVAGHLAMIETTSSLPCQQYVAGARRSGWPAPRARVRAGNA